MAVIELFLTKFWCRNPVRISLNATKFSCWSCDVTGACGVLVGAACWCRAPDSVTNTIVCLLLCNRQHTKFLMSFCTVTNTYGSHSCQSDVPVLRYSYCMRLEYWLSLYQCTLLPICPVATVQLLYVIGVLTVTISVHTVTNLYGSHSTVAVRNSNPTHKFLSLHN